MMMYSPKAGSLDRQAWAYQQSLDFDTGPWMGDTEPVVNGEVDTPRVLRMVGVPERSSRSVVSACVKVALLGGAAGYLAGRTGVLPVLAGLGAAAVVMRIGRSFLSRNGGGGEA